MNILSLKEEPKRSNFAGPGCVLMEEGKPDLSESNNTKCFRASDYVSQSSELKTTFSSLKDSVSGQFLCLSATDCRGITGYVKS